MKILTGASYSESRLYGIIAECFYSCVKRLCKQNDITTSLTGTVIKNTITGDVGYMIDENSIYYNLLPEIHKNRLIDIVDGDGWNDTESEV